MFSESWSRKKKHQESESSKTSMRLGFLIQSYEWNQLNYFKKNPQLKPWPRSCSTQFRILQSILLLEFIWSRSSNRHQAQFCPLHQSSSAHNKCKYLVFSTYHLPPSATQKKVHFNTVNNENDKKPDLF